MIPGIHISGEIFAIDVLTALKSSVEQRRKHVMRSYDHTETRLKATITLCDLSAAILFKLAQSRLNDFNLIQRYIVNSKELSRQIRLSKTSLNPSSHTTANIGDCKRTNVIECVKRTASEA